MRQTLPPAFLTLNYSMSSQSGNFQDLTAYSGHPPSFLIGSEAEPDNSSRHEFSQPTPLPSDMGLRYMINPSSDDTRFGPDSATAQNSVYSIEGSLQTSSPTAIPFSSFPNVFQPSLSGSTAYSSASSFFSPSYCMPDIKPIPGYHGLKLGLGFQSTDIKQELGSFSSPVMAPPTRSPHLPHLGSPATTRELYTSATPQLRRASEHILSRSPSASGTMRGLPLSPSSSSGFASPANMENSNKQNPPLNQTEHLIGLQTSDGTNVRPEILGKIDKGFFMADNDWTCYRRNYFQLSCSYTLHPFVPISNVHLLQGTSSLQIYGFSMSIAAVVDGRDGRAIELVQHTPKRDKGPQVRPDRVSLAPRPHPVTGAMYSSSGGDTPMGGTRSLYDSGYGTPNNQPQIEYTFERIQFKQATANNGKRRAAQQYYHLLVELFADCGASMGDNRWVKVAQRISAPMVVRGRSPGHYHSERRPSNAGSAGGSAGGGGGSYGSNSGMTPRAGDPMSLSTSSSAIPSTGYGNSYDQRSQYFPPAHASHIDTPMEPIMSSEEVKAIDEAEGYLYYPAPLFEGSVPHSRHRDPAPYTLPSVNSQKIKQEFSGHGHSGHGHGSYNLPSLTAGAPLDTLGRQCGRFEGQPSSRGYYPTMFTHPEVNTS